MDLSLAAIEAATAQIDPVFLRTPQYVDERLSAALGRSVLLKVETLNPIGSFKGRGTWLLGRALDPGATWVCSTAGNFGQGLAYAARAHQASIEIFVAPDASPGKVGRMRALGARISVDEDPEAAARAYAEADADRVLVVDGREPAIAEGAGTIAVELASAAPIDTAIIQVGDGALITGIARWLEHASPQTRIIGVCAAGAPAMAESFAARRPITVAGPGTIAAALATTSPVPESLERVLALVDEFVLVDDDDLRAAIDLIAKHVGVLVEPAGAAGVAALGRHRDRIPGERVAVLLTGAAA